MTMTLQPSASRVLHIPVKNESAESMRTRSLWIAFAAQSARSRLPAAVCHVLEGLQGTNQNMMRICEG